jgi:hypothetical protein
MIGILIKVLGVIVHLLRKGRPVLVQGHLELLHLQWIILLCLGMHLLVLLHLILLLRRHHIVLRTSHMLIVLIRHRRWLVHILLRHHLRHVSIHLLGSHYGLGHLEALTHLTLFLKSLEVLLDHSWSAALLTFKGSLTSITFNRL